MKCKAISFLFGLIIYSSAFSQAVKDLDQMNQVKLQAFIDTSNAVKGNEFRLLIIGNSLTFHGKSDAVGWYHESGMAASSKEKDFAHIIFKEIEGLLPQNKITMRLANFAEFERNFATYDFQKITHLVEFSPHLILFQLGENVSFDPVKTDSIFVNRYTNLINQFKKSNPIVICTLPFFPSNANNQSIKQVAYKTNSFIVDLSSLTPLDDKNLAINEGNTYPLDKTKWKSSGVGIHPGDVGMSNIAQTIFITIKAIDNLGMLVKKK
jgi:hypothetical protein